MKTATEAMAMIEAHGRSSRTLAANCRDRAMEVRSRAQAYADQHFGDAMEGKRQQILAQGDDEAQVHEQEALRHDDRARMAEAGYLLHTTVDQRDPSYAMAHQDLLAAAGTHGLLRSEV